MDTIREIHAQCDFCDDSCPPRTVTYYPHQSLSVCAPHVRLYPEVAEIEATFPSR